MYIKGGGYIQYRRQAKWNGSMLVYSRPIRFQLEHTGTSWKLPYANTCSIAGIVHTVVTLH